MVDTLAAMNILGIEMEAAGLYGLAAQYGAEALAVCAVSDHLRSHAQWSSEQRQNGVDAMVRLVLDAVLTA
jgi:purine-nucleoside phosphorylase